MKKCYLILSFLMMQPLYGQVTVSDAFQSTLKKISKERVKSEITQWISKQDVMVGIISKDIITQLIDNGKNEEAVLKSTANVTATMLFLGGIKKIAEEMLTEHPEFVDSAKAYHLQKTDLIAYTVLYYYYSERIKYNLYVSSEILKMQATKAIIENLQSKEGQKLPAVFGRYISKYKHGADKDRYYWLDVRVLEFIQFNYSELLLNPSGFPLSVESTFNSLRLVLKDGPPVETRGIQFIKQSVTDLVNAFQVSYHANPFFSLNRPMLNNEDDDLYRLLSANADDVNNILADPFNNLMQSSDYKFLDREGAKKVLISAVRQLLEQWINGAKQSDWKWEYNFSLGGTYFSNYTQSIDFTVIDQLRLVRHWENSALYIFIGGFFDPLIKNTLYKEGVKVYLSGVGYQVSNIHINLVLGIPYTDLKGKYGNGISVGYEVPLFDVFE